MTRPRRPLATAALVLGLAAGGASMWTIAGAQEDDSAEKGRFTRFVEETISTPDRKISIGSIDGVLSSDVRIDTITIADREGVWLTIGGAHLVWSRLALLRGRLDVDLLEAESITVTRPPLPATTPDPAAAPGFALPDLPVEVVIDRIAVPTIAIAEPVLGEAARLSVDGAVSLAGGTLDADLAIERTDDKPGTFAVKADYSDATRQLALDLRLEEPDNGVIANLIGIPGRPAIRFTIAGDGPLDAFAADIGLAAAGRDLVAGRATIAAEAAGAYRFRTDIGGDLAPLVPPAYAAYVEGRSTVTIDATRAADGAVTLATFDVASGVLGLAATGQIAPDGFPTAFTARGTLGVADGAPTPLPAGAGTIDAATFDLAFGGADERWSAAFDLTDLATGNIRAGRARITAGGAAENLAEPAARVVDFDVAGTLSDLSADDPALARALGDGFDLLARGRWEAGRPVAVEIAEIKNANAAVHFAGQVDGLVTDGRYWLNAADVAAFAGLAGQELAGALTLDSTGTIDLGSGGFALTLSSEAVDLTVGNPPLDALLAGRTTLAGGAFRTPEGLRFDGLSVENPQLSARIDGAYDLAAADLDVAARIADLARLTDRASGPLALTARIAGTGTAPAVTADLVADALVLNGRRLTGGRLAFDGRIDGARVDGSVDLAGNLDGVVLDGAARLASGDDGSRRVEGLTITAGGTRIDGDLTLTAAGLADGSLKVVSPDLAAVAPLALLDAAGALDADVTLIADNGRQGADVRASARDLRVETIRIGSAAIDARARDLTGVPLVDGSVEAAAITVGAVRVDRLAAAANLEGDTSRFTVGADLAAGRLDAAGALTRVADGFDLALDRLALTRAPDLSAALSAPTRVAIRGSAVTVEEAVLSVGSGRVAVTGSIAERVDLTAVVDALPLALGNAVAPDLGLGGTLSGRLVASGTQAAPVLDADLTGRGLTARPLRDAGVDALDVTARARYADGSATIDAATSLGGGTVTARGTVGSLLDLAVRVENLSAALANAASPGLGAEGRIGATLTVTGAPAAPRVVFDVTGSGLSVAQSRAVGVPALAVAAAGRYEGNVVTLDRATASGGGIELAADGRVPIAGPGLAVAVRGSVPLSIADRTLAERGTRVTGSAAVDVALSGSIAAPVVTGRIGVDGAAVSDPETTTRLTGITLAVSLDGQRAVIERFSAVPNGRGTITASGSVGIAPGSGFPVDLAVAIRGARFSDGRLVTADAGGDLAIGGSVAGTLTVSGRVDVARAEITVPESLPSGMTLLDVRHRLPPPNVARTLERARLATARGGDGGGSSGGVVLDVTIDAPARIFVRGRGIDAELGGSLTVQGPISAIRPVGSFELIRGRVVVIGQRIDFTRGSVTLQGDLDPYIDFVATTRTERITVTASVTGTASDPAIVLSSDPDLPQDEILARFLFGRSLSDLSPLQIANLAAAAAQLGGAGGGGLLDGIRKATGLDDLDVVTDEEGNAGVRVGRYIGENVYLGVTAGTRSSVSVNLDITPDLKARAEVGTEGDGKLGIFYEKEY